MKCQASSCPIHYDLTQVCRTINVISVTGYLHHLSTHRRFSQPHRLLHPARPVAESTSPGHLHTQISHCVSLPFVSYLEEIIFDSKRKFGEFGLSFDKL